MAANARLTERPDKSADAQVEMLQRAGRLQLARELGHAPQRVAEALADQAMLGVRSWITLLPRQLERGKEEALCFWLNSTPGLLLRILCANRPYLGRSAVPHEVARTLPAPDIDAHSKGVLPVACTNEGDSSSTRSPAGWRGTRAKPGIRVPHHMRPIPQGGMMLILRPSTAPDSSPAPMLLRLAITLLFAACLPAADQVNIVFVFIDDMGYGDLSCYGNEDVRTANIDRLAEEGSAVRAVLCRLAHLLALPRGDHHGAVSGTPPDPLLPEFPRAQPGARDARLPGSVRPGRRADLSRGRLRDRSLRQVAHGRGAGMSMMLRCRRPTDSTSLWCPSRALAIGSCLPEGSPTRAGSWAKAGFAMSRSMK